MSKVHRAPLMLSSFDMHKYIRHNPNEFRKVESPVHVGKGNNRN